MQRQQMNDPTPPGRESLKRGLAGFCALSAAGLGILHMTTARDGIGAARDHLSVGFLLLAVLATLGDWVLGAVRFNIFFARIHPGTRLSVPFKADLVGRFTGAVTPSQTGGGPGQIFMLYRSGIPLPDVLSVLAVNFVATLIFFLVVGTGAAWVLRDQFSGAAIQHLIQWAFVAFLGAVVFMGVSVTRPDLVARPIRRVTGRLAGDRRRWAQATRRAGEALVESAERYQVSFVRCVREWPLLPLAGFLLTVLLYLNKFTLAWLLVRGLGVEAPYVTTLAVQALLHFILYVAPTPGGSGIGELSTAALMALLLPTGLLVPFTVASRFFLVYLPAGVGAFILAHALRPRSATVAHAPLSRSREASGKARDVVAGVVASALALGALPQGILEGQGIPDRPPVVAAPVEALRARPEEADTLHLRRAGAVHEAVVRGVLAPCRADSLAAFQVAVDTARALVLAAPGDAHAHYLYAVALGNILELAGTREKIRLGGETRREAETALDLDPYHPGAHHVLGRLHAGAMRLSPVVRFVATRVLGADALAGASWERAEYHFSRARELEPWNPRHGMELGVLYLDTDRPALGLAALRQAASVPPPREVTDSLVLARVSRLIAALESPGPRASPQRSRNPSPGGSSGSTKNSLRPVIQALSETRGTTAGYGPTVALKPVTSLPPMK